MNPILHGWTHTSDGPVLGGQVTYVNKGIVRGNSFTGPNEVDLLGTEGFLASTVPSDGMYYSDRDEETDAKLRVVIRHYQLPEPPLTSKFGSLHLLEFDPFLCPFPSCSHPQLYARDHGFGDLGPFTIYPPSPIDPPRPPTIGPFDGWFMDLTPILGPSLREAFEAGHWDFANHVESFAVLRANEIDRRFVMVPTNNDQVAAYGFGVVQASDGKLNLFSTHFGMALSPGGKSVYSAYENTLFLVGGDAGGHTAGTFKIDLSDGTTTVLGVVPAVNVLAATYDSVTGRLFYLDEPGVGVGERMATLHAYDLSEGTTVDLWQVRYTGTNAVHMALTEERDVVIVSATLSAYRAWSFRPQKTELRLLGMTEGEGRVINSPVLGDHVLALPVVDSVGNVGTRMLEPSLFDKRQPCAEL